jgi:hypothetical protein
MRNGVLPLGLALILGLGCLLGDPGAAVAQMRGFQRSSPPDTAGKWYKVPGTRHGVSFFPRAVLPEVEYEAGEVLTFDRYHTAEVMYEWLGRWEERYPSLIEVYEVDRSFGGLPILMATLTNRDTGPATDKPAAYFEGGRHSGEVTSSESVLWLMNHLLESYGTDSEITHLLDTRAIYFRPQNNPDGSGMYLNTAQSNRSTIRPTDNDGDGLLDEDPNEDLDGDGVIHQIRYRPRPGTEDRATMVVDERDPTGRLLRRARDGEEGEWVVVSEGVDSDGDGRLNEDGIGGLDLHRNYPENWRPEPGLDETGRGYTQRGAGAFPLSEIETRSVVVWLLKNPNVSVANVMDTRVPMHLRPPSTSASAERMYPEDLAFYEYFDSLGMSITDYPWAGDVYFDYSTRRRDEDEPLRGSPLFGHGPDFGYWYYGSIWYGDELWNGGVMGDLNGDGERDQLDGLLWDDQELGGKGFREWEPLRHPTLGEVEIGGFHPKFFSQNGPPEVLEEWASKQALFNLEMAKHLPLLEMEEVRIRRAQDEEDRATYEITVEWKNVGKLPTALRQAQLVKIVREDRAILEFDRDLTGGEEPRVEIVDPSYSDKTFYAGWTEGGSTNRATFRVQVRGDDPVEGTVRVLSTRGGVLTAELTLGES